MRRGAGAGEVWAVEFAGRSEDLMAASGAGRGRGHVPGNSIKLAEARAGARNRAAM